MKKKSPKFRKSLRLIDFGYKGSSFIYFITLCTTDRQPLFSNTKIAKVVEDEMEYRRVNKEVKLYCYCIMPDHLHILLSFNDDFQKRLQDWVSAFKRHTSKVINELFNVRPLWQKNFYDHIVRKEESILKIAEYILNNPVRKGMALRWESYPYSRMVDPLPL